MTLREYGQRLYNLNVTVTRLVCLDLLDNADPRATEQLEELTEGLEPAEYARLFDCYPSDLHGLDDELRHEYVIETRRGWVAAAVIRLLENIRFFPDGTLSGHGFSCCSRPILVYNPSLEGALQEIVRQARAVREELLEQARRDQGLSDLEKNL